MGNGTEAAWRVPACSSATLQQRSSAPPSARLSGGAPEWLDRRGDLVDNAAEVLALIARHPHVRLSFHGHVHANTLTVRGPTAFVSLASAGEWPMQWREARLFGCEAELRTHQLAMPALLERSRC